jgi:tRNA(Arg) A34 adenosine deaminase TadA
VSDRAAPRRRLLGALVMAPLIGSRAHAESATTKPSHLAQPSTPSRAAFLARARELRDLAVAAGDQPYGAILVRQGLIVGEGRSQVIGLVDPTAHSELLAVRDAARRLGTRDLSDCDLYSSAMPCPMCQGALYWAGVRRIHTDATPDPGVVPKLGC